MIDDDDVIIQGEIDLRIEQWIRDMEENVLADYDIVEEDRAMLIYYLRLAYIQGWEDGIVEMADGFKALLKEHQNAPLSTDADEAPGNAV